MYVSAPAVCIGFPVNGRSTINTDANLSQPCLDIVERNDTYEIVSSLPGVLEEDLVVGLADGVLTIAAKAISKTNSVIGRVVVEDHRAGLVEQSFALPDDIDDGGVLASFVDNVVRVVIRRRQSPSARE